MVLQINGMPVAALHVLGPLQPTSVGGDLRKVNPSLDLDGDRRDQPVLDTKVQSAEFAVELIESALRKKVI